MSPLKKYDVIRVRRLRADRKEDAARLNKRSPRVGDIGAIVEVLHAVGFPELFMAESVEKDGSTLWLAEFSADELELVAPHEKGALI